MMLMPRARTRRVTMVITQSRSEPYFMWANNAEPYSFCIFQHVTIIIHPGVSCVVDDTVPAGATVVRATTYHVAQTAHLSVRHALRDTAQTVMHTRVYAAAHSTTDYLLKADGVITAWVTMLLHVQGPGVQMHMRGALNLRGRSMVTCTTEQLHESADSTSDVCVKGALHDQAQLYYHGTIMVAKDAQRTKAKQHNAVLLLSKQARTRAMPSLQVLAHNVRCTHGSAVGHFDDAQSMYLRSRGLAQKQIHALLLEAFFADMV